MEDIGQVLYGSFRYVASSPKPLRSTVGELHGIIGGLHRPGSAVNKAPLVAADDLGALGDHQRGGPIGRGLLDLDLERAIRRLPVLLAYL